MKPGKKAAPALIVCSRGTKASPPAAAGPGLRDDNEAFPVQKEPLPRQGDFLLAPRVAAGSGAGIVFRLFD